MLRRVNRNAALRAAAMRDAQSVSAVAADKVAQVISRGDVPALPASERFPSDHGASIMRPMATSKSAHNLPVDTDALRRTLAALAPASRRSPSR